MTRTTFLLVALLVIASFAGTMGAYANGDSVPIKSDRTAFDLNRSLGRRWQQDRSTIRCCPAAYDRL